MAKPIFIVRIPDTITGGRHKEILEATERKLHLEYHTFVVKESRKTIGFECFNGDMIPEIELEDLRKKLNMAADGKVN